MDSENSKRPIIIKRIKKVHGGHHGGSWKIAYADFVTAMMAFFLLMWLLSMMNKYQLQGIAEYFKKPLHEAFTKQDNIAKTNSLKPDNIGPTVDIATGAKERTENRADKSMGTLDKTQNPSATVQGNPQTTTKEIQNDQNSKQTKEEEEKLQQQQLEQMKVIKANLEAKLQNDPQISQYKNALDFIVTSEGLKIVMKDLENKPMFSTGKTDFNQYAEDILGWLSSEINDKAKRIMIIGHTDSIPYAKTAYYGNWELSADRANATRRVLVQTGMNDDKVLRVVGGADTDILENHHDIDPANRRIEIIMLTDQAIRRMQSE